MILSDFQMISRDFGDFYDREHIIYLNLTRSRGIIPLNTSRNGSKHVFLVIFGDVRRFSTFFRDFGDFCDREVLFTLIRHHREVLSLEKQLYFYYR